MKIQKNKKTKKTSVYQFKNKKIKQNALSNRWQCISFF